MYSEVRRFLLVGIGSNLINFVIYYFCNLLIFPLFLSALLGYSGGIFFSYTLARLWVFCEQFSSSKKRLVSFVVVYVIGGLGMSFLILLSTNLFKLDYRISWVIGAFFATVNNFYGQKFFVFQQKKKVSHG